MGFFHDGRNLSQLSFLFPSALPDSFVYFFSEGIDNLAWRSRRLYMTGMIGGGTFLMTKTGVMSWVDSLCAWE